MARGTTLTLSVGTRLGVFEIVGPLGAGGMGEVYRARDTTLHRDVAIKILPEAFAADTDRLARFRREAHLLAALNHPNIATIHGVEESSGVRALVLELIEGPTLADWIAARFSRGRRHDNSGTSESIAEIVAIARQIADALDAAHERGIVHRDLKPANVKIAEDGRVKVLDFGLAKIHAPAEGTANQEKSPTLSEMLTVGGVVFGTAPYMSPEQARGKMVDRRADIWAFGCILYEMLSGRQAFPSGETASDTLAGVLARQPDWAALPAATPGRLRVLIERCLRKDPRQRLRDIGDALPDLRDLPPDATLNATLASQRSRRRELVWATVAIAALAIAAIAAISSRPEPLPDTSVAAFTVEAPQRGPLEVGQPLSPDGRKLAFVAASGGGARVIWVRPIDSPTAQPLEGTENASNVFWSPDSQELGFLADGRLKRIPAAGGPAQVICTITEQQGSLGASWSAQGVILIGGRGPLVRVSAAGGQPVPATSLDTSAADQWHTAPDFLPDGRRFLFNVISGGFVSRQAYVGSLDSPDRQPLAGIRSPARYAPTGHILFTRGSALLAQTFDVDTRTLSGEPFEVAGRAASGNTSFFSVSANGSLAYLASPEIETELTWFDRAGTFLGLAAPRGTYLNPELSPDDQRIAVDFNIQGNIDIWTRDIARGITQRLTTHESADYAPVWSPDGSALAFTSYRGGLGRIYRREVDASADGDTLVLETTKEQRLYDWSRDGRFLVFVQEEPASNDRPAHEDIWALPLDTDAAPIRVTDTDYDEHGPRLSPDGHWIAYESNESGKSEVYVQSFPRPGVKRQVSAGDGRTPRWSADGTELYYVTTDGAVMAVPVSSSGDAIQLDTPMRLFQTDVAFTGIGRILNVSREGRFLLNVVPADRAAPSIVVVHHWAAGLAE